MTSPVFTSTMDVCLEDVMGDDRTAVERARVSTRGSSASSDDLDDKGLAGFLGHMVANRHGSVFEHAVMTFRISAPIFVAREFFRHRIASYNELSLRYSDAEPRFYVPGPNRPMTQVGKAAQYHLEESPEALVDTVRRQTMTSSLLAWDAYEAMRQDGVAREVARMVLPVNLYTTWYTTMNVRALTNFLSLRTENESAQTVSHPLLEIQLVADKMEALFGVYFPVTHDLWHRHGRSPL